MKIDIQKWIRAFWKQRYLQLLILPSVMWLLIFHYTPIFGLQIAFKDFSFRLGIWASHWAGFKHFIQLFRDVTIIDAVINTLGISILKIVLLFPMPILFALLLNEVRLPGVGRVIQTISYFPHFISFSVVAMMVSVWLSTDGFVNQMLVSLGLLDEPYLFLGEKNAFWLIIVGINFWKTTGWSSIIYFAALTGIDPTLYEAATIDGAGRFRKMWSITLPCLKPTIVMLFILTVGQIVRGSDFDLCYLLSNPLNLERAEILPTYVLRTGISLGGFPMPPRSDWFRAWFPSCWWYRPIICPIN